MDVPPHLHGRPLEHIATRVAAGEAASTHRLRAWWDRTPLWWIAVLFAIGSACFLVAALAVAVVVGDAPGIGVTFFVGSIFFTTAAYLQHWLSVRAVTGRAAAARARGSTSPIPRRGRTPTSTRSRR